MRLRRRHKTDAHDVAALVWIVQGVYYLITGVHALHVLGGVVVAGYLALRWTSSTGGDADRLGGRLGALKMYWYLVDIIWVCVFAAFYLL